MVFRRSRALIGLSSRLGQKLNLKNQQFLVQKLSVKRRACWENDLELKETTGSFIIAMIVVTKSLTTLETDPDPHVNGTSGVNIIDGLIENTMIPGNLKILTHNQTTPHAESLQSTSLLWFSKACYLRCHKLIKLIHKRTRGTISVVMDFWILKLPVQYVQCHG